MATIEKELARAEFWEGYVCLACGHIEEEEEDMDSSTCPECNTQCYVAATHARAFLARVRAEEEGE